MNPFECNTIDGNNSTIKNRLFCSAVSLFLLTSGSAYSQSTDSDPETALTRSVLLESQRLEVFAHKSDYGNSDAALTGMLIQLADTQSLIGEYEDAIATLKEALQVSRINHGLYHQSQIEILDELIVNEVLMENWGAVNSYYGLEEYIFRRMFEPTDARLEVGLEKITAWHVSAWNEEIDNIPHEHLTKIQELLLIRLDVIENVIGSDNARYDYLLNYLAYVESELKALRQKRYGGSGSGRPQHERVEIE